MTLICAAVNADTNVIVEKKIIIRITDSTSGGGSSGGGGGGGGGGSVSIPDTKIPTGIYEHGTVTVSPKSASKGGTVTITATPDKGITGGIGNGLFGPHNNCTRAQIITFLYRLYGSK